MTTKWWKLFVQWKDGTMTWEHLANRKESNPINVTEYAVAHGIHDEPAFAWWVLYMIKKRNRITTAVGKRATAKKNRKFGIRILCTWDEAFSLDKGTVTPNGIMQFETK
jgi:hypothetical protein